MRPGGEALLRDPVVLSLEWTAGVDHHVGAAIGYRLGEPRSLGVQAQRLELGGRPRCEPRHHRLGWLQTTPSQYQPQSRLARQGLADATAEIPVTTQHQTRVAHVVILPGHGQQTTDTAPLYQRLLGERFHVLPEPVRNMHGVLDELTAVGTAEIRRGQSLPSRLAGRLLGCPQRGAACRCV